MGKGFKKLMAMAAVSAMTLTTLAGCGSEDAGSAGGGDKLKCPHLFIDLGIA